MKAYILSIVNHNLELEKFIVFASTAEQARAWFERQVGNKEYFFYGADDVVEIDYNNIIRLGEYKNDIKLSKYVGMDEFKNSVEKHESYRVELEQEK